jgi:hypothetical protein
MKRSALCASVLACSMILAMGGCADQQKTEAQPAMAMSPAGTVNYYCVMNPDDKVEVNSPTTTWRGEKIGFCCGGCVGKWNKMTDAQKDAAVAAGKAKNNKM